MAFLLDTNIAIAIADERPTVWQRLATLDGPQVLSIITLAELAGGTAPDRDRPLQRKAALDAIVYLHEVLPLERDAVAIYASIVQQIGFSRPRILDRLIAATAIVHDMTVVTTNGPDFANIPGLKLEIWPRPAQ